MRHGSCRAPSPAAMNVAELGMVCVVQLSRAMRDLRRTLASIVLAAPLGGCLPGSCPKVDPIEETVAVPAMPDPMRRTDLMACRGDAITCEVFGGDVYTPRHTDYRWFPTC